VLEEMNIERRLKKTLGMFVFFIPSAFVHAAKKPTELVKEEYLQLRLQQEIAKEVEDKITKTRRTAMLHEQLNVIKKELGLSKGFSSRWPVSLF
jgi:ATP-dependent Lon protease